MEIDELKQIQIGLMDLGYEIGAVDGNLGAASRNALRTFQRRSSLQETGYLNDATIKNLYDKLTKSPQGYDGNWILDIHRYNYNKRDPGGINLRTHLASARIEVRSGDMFITSSEILTDRKGQFDTFRGEISSSGRIGISMKLDYLYGKPRTGTLKFNNILPRIVPVGQEFEYKANQIEQEIWYKIVLRRSS